MEIKETHAPGKPGIEAKWTSSAKAGVGTALTGASAIWFTLSHGIVNEVYFPRIDLANTRDMGLLITNGTDFFSEEKRDADHDYALISPGVPAYHLTNTCQQKRYRIEKIVFSDPDRCVLLQKINFAPLKGKLEDYRVYVLLAPHLGNCGSNNNGWCGDYKGIPTLFAQRNGIALACSCSTPFLGMNCGYVGISDSWQDISKNKKMTWFYKKADEGNIALAAEIDLQSCGGEFILGLGFGLHPEEAGLETRLSLTADFTSALNRYISLWEKSHASCWELEKVDSEGAKHFLSSKAVLKTHQGKQFAGSMIASLSIPWGSSKGDFDLGGYHLIWPRDMVNSAIACLASGDKKGALDGIHFLIGTQEPEGHWPQCFWVDGSPYWKGLQLDEVGFPILLADLLKRDNCLLPFDTYTMVKKAAKFLIGNGPMTGQDRWEEIGGITPYTLSIEIAALLAAADWFDSNEENEAADHLQLTADSWYESIDKWLYFNDCYVRFNPLQDDEMILLKNKPAEESRYSFKEVISVDALALVRFGLRLPDDPRIIQTVEKIDQLLKSETTKGPVWHRYNHDGYGEHADGSPFNGIGIGRGWPLLTGERAHYELASGRKEEALQLLRTFSKMAGAGGLFPEQIWDTEDIPNKALFNGHSTGSAKPLVWAHAEYLTLLRSISDGKVFGMPTQTVERYLQHPFSSQTAVWSHRNQLSDIGGKDTLRIQTDKPARLRYSFDGWKTAQDRDLNELKALEIYYIDLKVESENLTFTLFYPEEDAWEGKDYFLKK